MSIHNGGKHGIDQVRNMPEFDGKFKNDGKMRKIINLPRTDPYLERFKKTL